MRILYQAVHPSNGGGVAVFSQLLKERLSGAIDMDIVAVGARNTVSGVALESGLLNTIKRTVLDLTNAVRLVRHGNYDAVHLNPSLGAKAVLRDGVFLLYLRAFGPRQVLVFFHGWSLEFSYKIMANPLMRTMFRWAYGWVPATIVLSETFRRWLLDVGFREDRVITSSTMFDGDPLKRIADEHVGQARRQRANDQKIRLIFISRVERDKGVYDLVDAVSDLTNRYAGIQLDVVGEGVELQRLRTHAKELGVSDHVTFHGYIDDPRKKADLLLYADVFCLPTSHGEGMPVSLLEAMGAGLAVISTKVGGISEACAASGAILLDESTPAGIATAVKSLLEDPEYRLSLQQRSRARAWELYEARTVAGQIESCYQAIVAASAPQTAARTPRSIHSG